MQTLNSKRSETEPTNSVANLLKGHKLNPKSDNGVKIIRSIPPDTFVAKLANLNPKLKTLRNDSLKENTT